MIDDTLCELSSSQPSPSLRSEYCSLEYGWKYHNKRFVYKFVYIYIYIYISIYLPTKTMTSSSGAMLTREEESEAEVRAIDQQMINAFGRLNARLQEVRGEKEGVQKQLEVMDDASTELMMATGASTVLLQMGDCFFEVGEDEATEFTEEQTEKLQDKIDALSVEEGEIVKEQAKLKVVLYGRFGKSINLEA